MVPSSKKKEEEEGEGAGDYKVLKPLPSHSS
jgi:hypothetical protein